MCGIAGIFHFSSAAGVAVDELEAMGEMLAHRGPDDDGWFVGSDGRVGLAHRRLAIVDPQAGQQPFHGTSGTVLVFNGEIYNYPRLRRDVERDGISLTTHCDTEIVSVLYERHGAEMVTMLDGMFALAIWDPHKRRLFVARDRLGEKPLYWTDHGGVLRFASEIKALFAAGTLQPEVDESAVPSYFADLVTTAPRTLFQGVSKLPPGCAAVCDARGMRPYQYWSVQDLRSWEHPSPPDATARIRDLLTDSIHDRLLGDVPMGVLLSGGLDSTTVLALLAERATELMSFSVGFPEHPALDERAEARAVAHHFGVDHAEISVSERDAIDFLPDLIYHQDEPLGDPVCIPLHFVCKLARAHGVKVVLAGEGADELFWGYPDYVEGLRRMRWIAPLLALPEFGRRWAAALVAMYPRSHISQLAPGIAAGRLRPMHSSVGMTGPDRRRLLRMQENWAATRPPTADVVHRGVDLLALDTQEFEFGVRLPELLLMRIDRFSMANGVEARVPFLSPRLVEYVYRLPLEFKIDAQTTKIALREAVAGSVPRWVLERPKRGFGAPVSAWLLGYMGTVLDQLVAGEGARRYFDVDFLREAVLADRAGRGTSGPRIWPILNFLLWHRLWIEGEPLEPLLAPLAAPARSG